MYSYGGCFAEKYHPCLTSPEGGYQKKLVSSFSALKPATSECLWTCGIGGSHTEDNLALFFHCSPWLLTCAPAVAFGELVNLELQSKSTETMICVCRPGSCVQSKEPHGHRSMGPGNARHRKLAWSVRWRKYFQQNPLWKWAVGVWEKYPMSMVRWEGSLIVCQTRQGKERWILIVIGVQVCRMPSNIHSPFLP